MSRHQSARETSFRDRGNNRTIPSNTDTPWTARQVHLSDQPGSWIDPAFPAFDAPFVDEHAQAESFDPSQSCPIPRLEEPQTHGDPANLLFHLEPSLLVPIPSALIGPAGPYGGQGYDEILGHAVPRLQDDQWSGQRVGSTSSLRESSRILMPSSTRLNAARLDYFDTDNGLFVDPHRTWLPPSSLEPSFQGHPQTSEAANVIISGGNFLDATAEQDRTWEAAFNEMWEVAVPPLTGLMDLDLSQQGTQVHQPCGDQADHTKNVGCDSAMSDTAHDHNSCIVIAQKPQSDRRDKSPSTIVETSETTTESAPTPIPTTRTAIAKITRRPKAPNANLTLADGLGKFATSRVRKAFSEDRRQEVAMTRRVGACFRCKVAKVTCHRLNAADSICERCLSGRLPASQICFKLDLSDCGFFRSESALHSEPFKNDFNWVTSATIPLEVKMTPFEHGESLKLTCRHFRPQINDLRVEYVRGSIPDEVIEVPTYAAVDTQALQMETKRLARQYGYHFLHGLEALGASEFVRRTLQEAFRYAAEKPQSLVNKALDLWAGSKLCQHKRTLDGNETLGLDVIIDTQSPIYMQIPIPPVLDHQCDAAIIQWMRALGTQLITLLWQKISARKQKDWFEVFLTGFVLINNIEYVYGLQKEYVQMYSMTTDDISSRTRKKSEKMMEQWRWSAQHLLYVCKTYFAKFRPLSSSSPEKASDIAGLDPSHVAYLHYVTESKDAILAGRRSLFEVGDFNYELVWGVELLEAM